MKDIYEQVAQVNKDNAPLNYIFASDLPNEFNPPDEILEGLLVAGDGSILYGDSNSGKTFLAVDMGASIASGTRWFNRKTEPGLVIYLAAESPASILRRLQAYQNHHRIRLPNFVVIPNPIDLFSSERDTHRIIQCVKEIEAKTNQKARLIIGDTLARLSAGANENAGQDMGTVIQHFDIIKEETQAHFMFIHHSGKNAAAGARGWSGVRAAVDTEMEVTDSPEGRCLEITKQRDLDTKGLRIGFRLEPILLGKSKFGGQMGSCVVRSNDAPSKNNKKKKGEISGAILQILMKNRADCLCPVDRKSLVGMLSIKNGGLYQDTSVYKEIRKLIESGEVIDINGNIVLP
jgi:putative DNA primase/helicase